MYGRTAAIARNPIFHHGSGASLKPVKSVQNVDHSNSHFLHFRQTSVAVTSDSSSDEDDVVEDTTLAVRKPIQLPESEDEDAEEEEDDDDPVQVTLPGGIPPPLGLTLQEIDQVGGFGQGTFYPLAEDKDLFAPGEGLIDFDLSGNIPATSATKKKKAKRRKRRDEDSADTSVRPDSDGNRFTPTHSQKEDRRKQQQAALLQQNQGAGTPSSALRPRDMSNLEQNLEQDSMVSTRKQKEKATESQNGTSPAENAPTPADGVQPQPKENSTNAGNYPDLTEEGQTLAHVSTTMEDDGKQQADAGKTQAVEGKQQADAGKTPVDDDSDDDATEVEEAEGTKSTSKDPDGRKASSQVPQVVKASTLSTTKSTKPSANAKEDESVASTLSTKDSPSPSSQKTKPSVASAPKQGSSASWLDDSWGPMVHASPTFVEMVKANNVPPSIQQQFHSLQAKATSKMVNDNKLKSKAVKNELFKMDKICFGQKMEVFLLRSVAQANVDLKDKNKQLHAKLQQAQRKLSMQSGRARIPKAAVMVAVHKSKADINDVTNWAKEVYWMTCKFITCDEERDRAAEKCYVALGKNFADDVTKRGWENAFGPVICKGIGYERNYLAQELKKVAYRVLDGHSLGGVFPTYTDLLKICAQRKVKKGDPNETSLMDWYWTEFMPKVLHNSEWSKHMYHVTIRGFTDEKGQKVCTYQMEAFGIICWENNEEKWQEDHAARKIDPNCKLENRGGKYTTTTSGQNS